MFHFSFTGYSISFASVSTVMLSLLEPDMSKNRQGIEVGVTSFNIITTHGLIQKQSNNFIECLLNGWFWIVSSTPLLNIEKGLKFYIKS